MVKFPPTLLVEDCKNNDTSRCFGNRGWTEWFYRECAIIQSGRESFMCRKGEIPALCHRREFIA